MYYRRIVGEIAALLLLASCKPTTQVEAPSRAKPTPPVRHVAAKAAPEPIKPIPVATTGASLQQERWSKARIKPSFSISVDKAAMLYLRTKDRYEKVEGMHASGVPAPVAFTILMRESDNSFRAHPHNGDSLLQRTHNVPRGRLPAPKNPPFTFEDSAADAFYVCDHMDGPWTDLTWSINKTENYNGGAYRKMGIPSPYIWSGTTEYERGKFVSDGRFSATTVDQQVGCAAVWIRLKERGVTLKFAQ